MAHPPEDDLTLICDRCNDRLVTSSMEDKNARLNTKCPFCPAYFTDAKLTDYVKTMADAAAAAAAAAADVATAERTKKKNSDQNLRNLTERVNAEDATAEAETAAEALRPSGATAEAAEAAEAAAAGVPYTPKGKSTKPSMTSTFEWRIQLKKNIKLSLLTNDCYQQFLDTVFDYSPGGPGTAILEGVDVTPFREFSLETLEEMERLYDEHEYLSRLVVDEEPEFDDGEESDDDDDENKYIAHTKLAAKLMISKHTLYAKEIKVQSIENQLSDAEVSEELEQLKEEINTLRDEITAVDAEITRLNINDPNYIWNERLKAMEKEDNKTRAAVQPISSFDHDNGDEIKNVRSMLWSVSRYLLKKRLCLFWKAKLEDEQRDGTYRLDHPIVKAFNLWERSFTVWETTTLTSILTYLFGLGEKFTHTDVSDTLGEDMCTYVKYVLQKLYNQIFEVSDSASADDSAGASAGASADDSMGAYVQTLWDKSPIGIILADKGITRGGEKYEDKNRQRVGRSKSVFPLDGDDSLASHEDDMGGSLALRGDDTKNLERRAARLAKLEARQLQIEFYKQQLIIRRLEYRDHKRFKHVLKRKRGQSRLPSPKKKKLSPGELAAKKRAYEERSRVRHKKAAAEAAKLWNCTLRF